MTSDLKPYPAYKDSGVEWLGEVPAHWDVSRLSFLFTRSNAGEVIDKGHWGEGNELLFTCAREPLSSDYSDFPMEKRTTVRDLLLTRNGTPYVHKPPANAIYSNVVQRITLKSGFDRDYVSHSLGAACQGLKGDGVSIESLNFEMWKLLCVAFPAEHEQTAIVRFLDHADRRIRRYIRAKQKLIALLEEQKQAIIHQAVTGQIDVRTGEPYAAYKPSGVEWLGDVPEHWERRRLKTLLRSVDRRSLTGKETLLSLRRDHGVVVYAEHFARPPQGRTLVGFKLVSSGQLVVNRMQANNGLVFCSRINGLVSPDYSAFEMREPIQMQYLSDLLRTVGYRAHFRRESTGLGTGTAGFLRLYDEKLLETKVFLPTAGEQILILKSLAECMAKIDRLREREQRELH